LSQENIYHGDIKPGNIFFDEDDNKKPFIVYADLDTVKKNNEPSNASLCGTNAYIDETSIQTILKTISNPNEAQKYKTAAENHDIFSTGITLYEVLTSGSQPFIDVTMGSIGITSGTFDERTLNRALNGLPNDKKTAITDLVKRMVSFNSAERPTVVELAAIGENLFKVEIDADDDDE
jgi:serine/threonine protein kinase